VPDELPSRLFSEAIDAARHTRIGGGDPGDLATYIARYLEERAYVVRSRFENLPAGSVISADQQAGFYRALSHISRLAGLHYVGGAFEPEHMRLIADLAADALAGRPIPPPVDVRVPAAIEAAEEYGAWIRSEIGEEEGK